MTGTEVSTTEMLLTNLNDHKVVRIEGSANWCQEMYQRINQLPNLSVVKLEGNLSFPETKMRVSAAISDGSVSTLVWLDPDGADVEIFSYLFTLARDVASPGKIILLLKNSSHLDSLLSEVDPALAYADGFYQEEVRRISNASNGQSSILPVAVLVVACTVGGVYWYQSNSDSQTAQYSKESSDVVGKVKPKTVYAWSKPASTPPSESSAEQPSGEPLVSKKVVVEKTAPLNIKEENSSTMIQQERMLSEFSAVLEKDNSKDSVTAGVIEKDEHREVASVTPEKIMPIAEAATNVIKAPAPIKPANVTKVTKTDDAVMLDSSPSYSEPATSDTKRLVEQASMQKEEAVNARKASASIEEQSHRAETIPATGDPLITTYTLKEGRGVISKEEQVSVVKVVDRWARAWAAQDWDNYIDSYIAGKPYGIKVSLAEWRAFRKDRLISPEWVQLKFGQPTMTVYDPHWVKVELYQRFEKPGYADETTKRLELKRTLDGWKIASEATDGTVVLSR